MVVGVGRRAHNERLGRLSCISVV